MHKHFRMIAISEHLRNHGFDPDVHQHTRIPHIWQKLRTFYNLDIIDERENFDDDDEDRYDEFSLPRGDFYGRMMQRAVSEAPTSPAELDLENPHSGYSAKKEASTGPRVGSRGRKRAASRAKDKADTTEEEDGGDEDEEEDEDDEEEGSSSAGGEEESEEESTTQTKKRAPAKGRPKKASRPNQRARRSSRKR